MENLIVDGISVIDFVFYSAMFVLGMVSFLNRRTAWSHAVHYLWGALFLFAWGSAVVSSRPIETKVFVSLLIVSSIVLQVSIAFRQRQNNLTAK